MPGSIVGSIRRFFFGATTVPSRSGEVAKDVMLNATEAQSAFFAAFASSVRPDRANFGDVVWDDCDNELIVRVSKVRFFARPGLLHVVIKVFAKETGEADVIVTFAVGKPGAGVGLLAAREPSPRGPAEIINQWGDRLVAAAWESLLRTVVTVAAAAGVDEDNAVLLPALIIADKDALIVTPQARHSIDRAARP